MMCYNKVVTKGTEKKEQRTIEKRSQNGTTL